MKKIIQTGSSFRSINEDAVVIHDRLPPGVYDMKYADLQGFWLEHSELEAFTGKIYGSHQQIADKIMRRYETTSGRNLGILLSGSKGTGKSMLAKNIAVQMSNTYPVIVIKRNYGLGMFTELAAIKGKVVIVFDEFEKLFSGSSEKALNFDSSNGGDQDKLLSFFDGVEAQQEKLFLLTANETINISTYLLGRPGRVYYHFKLAIPTREDIHEYLKDNLAGRTDDFIQQTAVTLAAKAMNWDSLSAVVTELNHGESLEDTLRDLNISHGTSAGKEILCEVLFEDGQTVHVHDTISLREQNSEYASFYLRYQNEEKTRILAEIKVTFSVKDCIPTGNIGEYKIVNYKTVVSPYIEDGNIPIIPGIKEILFHRKDSYHTMLSGRFSPWDYL